MANEALYERVLAFVEPQELHHSCNGVLQEDYDSLREVVDGVAAAFAKVEEVRDAVKQLEHGKPSAGRSASLMATMDSTMEAHKELKQMLNILAADMKVQAEVKADKEEKTKEKKRKRCSEVPLGENKKQQRKDHAESLSNETSSSMASPSSSSSSSDDLVEENEEADGKSTHKQATVDNQKVTLNKGADPSPIETKPAENTASLQLAQECLETVLLLKGATKLPVEMKERWPQALDGVKKILKEKARPDAVLTSDAAVRMAGHVLKHAAVLANELDWTSELAAEVQSLISAVADACSRNKTLTIHFQSTRIKMECLFRRMQSHGFAVGSEGGEVVKEQLQIYQKLVKEMVSLPDRESSQHIMKSLSAMQKVLVNDNDCKHRDEIQNAVGLVRHWALHLPLDESLRRSYGLFTHAAVVYIMRLGDEEVALRRLAATIPNLVNKRLNKIRKRAT